MQIIQQSSLHEKQQMCARFCLSSADFKGEYSAHHFPVSSITGSQSSESGPF